MCAAGVTTVIKALSLCSAPESVWPVFKQACSRGVIDARLCNTVLAHCMRHRESAHCEEVRAVMLANAIAPTEVTQSLLDKASTAALSAPASSQSVTAKVPPAGMCCHILEHIVVDRYW